MKKFRVGIAGYGWASGAHITAINKTAAGKVTAIYSSRALAPNELEERHAVPLTIYRRYEDMLADDSLDVISICSYPDHHARQAVAAAKAGKHLIIEKPLALSWKDCLAVRSAV